MRSSFRLMSVRTLFVIVLFCRNFEMTCEAYGPCPERGGEPCEQTYNIDHAECTLECDEGDCAQTFNNGNCGLECRGKPCTQTCNNDRGKCRLKCDGGDCVQTCNNGNCSLEYRGKPCTQTCNNDHGECTLKCDGGDCVQTCNKGCPLSQTTPVSSSLLSSSRTITPSSSKTKSEKTTSVISQSSSALLSSLASASSRSSSTTTTPSVALSVTVSTLSPSSSLSSPASSAALSSLASASLRSSSSTTTLSEAPSATVSTSSPASPISSAASSSLLSALSRSSSIATMPVKAAATLSLASSTTASKDAPDKSQNISLTEELVKKFISALNTTDPQQDTSLQDAVSLLQNTTEQLTNISHVITEQEREGFVFKVVAAFEDFSLNYSHYHLNESMPQLTIAHSKLILHIQRFFRRNARDFILKGPEKQNFINIPSRNFLNNDSVLLGIVYKDLHEVLKWNPSNSDANKNSRSLDTMIMAATMDPNPEKLRQNITLKFRNLKVADGKRYCMFWSGYSEKNPEGWSGEGCHIVRSKSSSGQTECSCNHMTHFAVLFDYGDNLEITKSDEKILKILTYVGLALSIIGIIFTIIFYAYFTDVHQPLSQIRMSLAGSLGAGQVIFLAGINATGNTGACVAVAALMQYFLMAAFCWMLVEGIYLYLFVVKVYNINNKMTLYYVMSWGFPAVMVAISLSIAAGKDGIQNFVSEEYCWMSSDNNLIWIFVAFVVIIEVVNISILLRVIKEMTTMQSTGENHIQQIRLGIKACVVLIPLLVVTWLFGLLSPLHKAFVYIFTILNSAQGFLIFLLHCLRNSQIKQRFRRRINAVFPRANDVNSAKKTSQFNQSEVDISRAIELQSCSNSVFELK